MKIFFSFFLLCAHLGAQSIQTLYQTYRAREKSFGLAPLELDYRDNLAAIPLLPALGIQEKIIDSLARILGKQDTTTLAGENRVLYRTMRFEFTLHLERIRLSRQWRSKPIHLTENGLHQLPDGKDWYTYFIRRFTGLDLSAQEVLRIGEEEVAAAKRQIAAVKTELGFKSDALFYHFLQEQSQFFTSKDSILAHFYAIDRTVRAALHLYFDVPSPPPIEPMEWQGAGPQTPPGIYLSRRYNAYGADVFQYNFYNRSFNKRCLDWIYLHEAVPGHHLQSQYLREEESFYFGSSEGWACYVEKLGGGLGLYSDLLRKLGEHEWNLVRSARLVMEAGIHFYGWDRAKALTYWKDNIYGQDQIAEREITRITSWPGQATCYKAGARAIGQIMEKLLLEGHNIRQAHAVVLRYSHLPLYALM